jgi:PAS domain S-box-containing protein
MISLTTWNREALKTCSIPMDKHYSLSDAGNWADCVREGKPVIYNDYSASPNQKGLPEGHTPVSRIMSVPVEVDGQVRLIIGVGNKTDPYSSLDLQQIQIIAAELQRIIGQEDNLRKIANSEALKRTVLNSIIDHVAVINRSGEIIEVNVPWLEFGYQNGIVNPMGTIVGVNYLDVLRRASFSGDLEISQLCDNIGKVLEGILSGFITEYECNSPDEVRWFQMNVTPLLSPEGGAVITHRNITRIKENDLKIRESEKRYRLIAENMSDVIWVLNLNSNKLEYISPSVEKLRGFTPAEVLKQPWKDQATPESMEVIESLLPGLIDDFLSGEQKRINYEVEQPCKGNKTVWTEVSAHFRIDPDTGDLLLFGSSRDISDKKQILDELKLSEARFFSAFRYAGTGFALVDLQDRFFKVNEALCRIVGYSHDELTNMTYHDITHPDDLDIVLPFGPKFENQEVNSFTVEKKYLHKSGRIVYVQVIIVLVRDEKGTPQFRIAQIIDITEQTISNMKLREDQKIFRILNDLMSDYVFRLKVEDNQVQGMSIIAGNYFQATGREPEVVKGIEGWKDFIHPDDYPGLLKAFHQVLTSHTSVEIECRSYTVDKQLRWLEILATPEFGTGTGSLSGIYGSVRNITAKKIAYETLKQSEAQLIRLSQAVEQSSASLIITDLSGKIEYVNKRFTEITGYSAAEVLGENPRILKSGMTPDEHYKVIWDTIKSGSNWNGELLNKRKNGELFWELVSISPIRDKDGLITHFLAVKEDITVQKRKETLFLESEKKYRNLFETMAQGVVYQNREGAIISANPSAEVILGLSMEQMTGVKSIDPRWKAVREDGSDFPGSVHPAMVALQTGKTTTAVMGVFNPHENRYRWINVNAMPDFREGEHEPWQVCTTFEDITRLKETMIELNAINRDLEVRVNERTQEIRRLSQLHQAILKHAGLAIIATTTDGTIELFNEAAEAILGYQASEMIGIESPGKFHDPQELIERAKEIGMQPDHTGHVGFELFRKILTLRFQDTSEWIYVRKNGTRFPVKLTISTLHDSDSQVIGYIGIAMDITHEKAVIESLRQSEERFHTMFHEHAAVMLLIDPDNGDIIEANQAAQQFYGYRFDADPLINIRSINDEDHNITAEAMGQAMNFNKNYFEFRHRLNDGERRDVEVHSTPIEINGKIILFSIIHDISDRHRTEMLLKNSERENRAIISAIPDLMFRIHADGTYLNFHSYDESILYVSQEQFIGKKIPDVLPPDLAKQSMKAIQQALDTGKVVAYEYDLLIQGSSRYFENRIIAISSTVVLSIIRDITERKNAEEQLRDTMKKLSILIQNLQGGTLFESIDRKITLVNQSFCDIFNINVHPDNLIGTDCVRSAESSKLLMKEPERFLQRVDEVITGGDIVLNDVLRMADGRILERDYIPIYHQELLLGHFWQYRDVTERRMAEHYIRIQRDLATRLSAVSDLETALHTTLESLLQIDGIDCGGIYLINNKTQVPELISHMGLSESFVEKRKIYTLEDPRTIIAKSGSALYGRYCDLVPDCVPLAERDNILGLAIIPITYEDKILGIINLGSKSLETIPTVLRLPLEVLAMSIGVALARITAENALISSKKNFQVLFDTLDDFMFILDIAGNIIVTNPVVQKRLGYAPEELKGLHVLEVHPPERRAEAAKIVEEMLQGKARFCPVPLYTKSGDQIPVETRVILGQWDNETVLYGISRDITERQKAEAALRMQSAAFESFALPIIITDIKGTIQWANSSYSRLTGYNLEEVIGKNPGTLQRSGQQSREFYNDMWNAILNNQIWTGELINRRKDNSLYYEEETITPILDYKGNVSGFIAIKIDISDRKAMEQSLRDSIEREKELNELKSKFISVASHEFRTPLATILASSESLLTYRHRMNNDQQEQRLFKIKDKVNDLNRIIEEMLHLSKMQAREKPLEPETFDIGELVNECLDEFRNTHGEQVVLKFEPSDNHIGVFLDKKQIRAIITNLVSNAIKYSIEGGIIMIRLERTEKFVSFSIQDHGIGIPEEDLKHLFEPFFRASNAINLPGTGLGLNIVKETVERHSGKISVTSKLNEGTEIHVILPQTI